MRRFGVVGAGGYWGPNWVRVLSQLKCLAAICDIDKVRLQNVIKRFELDHSSIKILDNYDKLVALDLDGIFIATPPDTHAVLAVQALQSNKHVFIEKPLADNLEDSYKIKFESERLKRIVMVGHTFIYHPMIRQFKKSLPEIGAIRTIYTVRTNFGQYQTAGLVKDLLPHDLSIFNYLCERMPESVEASVNPNQDVGFVMCKYGKVICSAFLSWGYPDKTRKLSAIGEKGILEWDLPNTHLLLHHKWSKPTSHGRFEHFDEGVTKIMVCDQSEPLTNEALHFIECIEENKQPLTGVEDGINVVKGLEACQ
jgi:predicted dehydrogenase